MESLDALSLLADSTSLLPIRFPPAVVPSSVCFSLQGSRDPALVRVAPSLFCARCFEEVAIGVRSVVPSLCVL